MKIEEAIQQLQDFITAYENEEIRRSIISKFGSLGGVSKDYVATKILIQAYQEQVEINKRLDDEIRRLVRGDLEI